nr:MAG TPA: hypothetical protein [Caudoviricetes sp.]
MFFTYHIRRFFPSLIFLPIKSLLIRSLNITKSSYF